MPSSREKRKRISTAPCRRSEGAAFGFRLSAIGYPLSTASLCLINQLVVPQTQKREAADRHYLYADRYLSENVSFPAHTEILRLRLRMTMGPGRLSRNADFTLIAAKRRYHHPLNPLNPLNLLNPHAAGVSKGATTTLSHVVAVKPMNLKNLRLREPSTLTPAGRVQRRPYTHQKKLLESRSFSIAGGGARS